MEKETEIIRYGNEDGVTTENLWRYDYENMEMGYADVNEDIEIERWRCI